jgi:hypothetical protein
MIKRLIIVLAIILGIVFIPYFSGFDLKVERDSLLLIWIKRSASLVVVGMILSGIYIIYEGIIIPVIKWIKNG